MGREENETKKQYLRGYERACRKQRRVEEELETIRNEKILPGITADGMPHGSRKCNDLSEYMVRLLEIETEYEEEKLKLLETRKRIVDSIEELHSENEKDVLKARYIDLLSWEAICQRMHYEWAQVHRFHANALQHLKINDTQ